MEKSELTSPAYERNLGEGNFVGGIFDVFSSVHIWRCRYCGMIVRQKGEPDKYYKGGCKVGNRYEDKNRGIFYHDWDDEGVSRE